ncbi:nitrate- and nitrite sensing domain-containing protein [Streptomyces sp. NPDC002499]
MPTTSRPARRRLSVRNWRVARKLHAILLVPVLVALVLGGLRVRNSVDTWQAADDAVRVAELVQAANRYASDAINERDVSVAPLLNGDRTSSTVAQARRITDADAVAFDRAVARMPKTPGLLRRVQLVRAGEQLLPTVRAQAFTSQLKGVRAEESYHALQHPLMEISNELGFGSSNQASFGRTLYAISLTQAAESLIRSIGVHLLVEDRSTLAPGELQAQLGSFSSYVYLEQVALQEYAGAGTADDMTRLREALAAAEERGKAQTAQAAAQAKAGGETFVAPPTLAQMNSAIGSGRSASELAAQGITPDSFFAASTLGFDAYRGIEVNLTDTALAGAHDIADDARSEAITNAVLVLVSILVALLLASWMARSMSRSMRQLSAAAHEIAEQRLPATLDRLTRSVPESVDRQVEPIPITTRDEIGEVARAFDHVHREAVRIGAQQAIVRGNFNTIFTNLARRNHSLIERQLALITDLEGKEADPDQLASLFKLDHVATRVRRNGENLLVLGGEEPTQQWDHPLPLVDVIRAATAEVEQYERIEVSGVPETEINGPAVTDLVHLLAELMENATIFSSPQSKVRVTAAGLPDGMTMVEIHDEGIGLPPAELADLNHGLANPPTVGVSISQRMGLFVVGRLADRHGIRAQLRPSAAGTGTTALVMLPRTIIHGAPEPAVDADSTTLSLAVPAGTLPGFESWDEPSTHRK